MSAALQLSIDNNPWCTACPDWQSRIAKGQSLVPTLPLIRAEADRALRVFKRLRVPDMPGAPTNGAVAGPWLFPIVEAIFGCYDHTAARRHLNEFFLLVSKKNSKTSSSAAIMLTALIVNRRPMADLTLIAPTMDVAARAYAQAMGAIKLDDELSKIFQIQNHLRRITDRRNGSSLQVRSADTEVVTGLKSTCTLIDETHVFASKSNAADVFLEIRGALAARPDGFVMQITTQSKTPPAGVFKQELRNARDVRDGELELPLLPILYEFPPDVMQKELWREPKYWGWVNPNLGRSVDEQFLVREFKKAQRDGPRALALFASQHLNVEVGLQLRHDQWVGNDYWAGATDPELTREELLNRSEVVIVGLDGGGMDDLFGLALLGREAGGSGRWLLWTHSWVHEGVMQRRPSIAPRLQDAAGAGELTLVDNRLTDKVEIVKLIEEIKARGLLGAVAVDPAGIGEMVDALAEIDVTQENKLLVGVGQSYRLMNAIKTAERRLASGMLSVAPSALMAWCVSNLKIEPTATAIRATKQNLGDLKIDPAMAMFDAVDLMSLNPEPRKAPSYDVFFA